MTLLLDILRHHSLMMHRTVLCCGLLFQLMVGIQAAGSSGGQAEEPQCRSSSPEWDDMYAAKGVSWNCLMTQMGTPFCKNYTEFAVRAGLVTCPEDKAGEGCWGTACLIMQIPELFLGLLVLVHMALAIAPIYYIWRIYNVSKKLEGAGCNSVAVMLMAMPLFSVCSFAEIAQHTFDNWLLLGLVPTVCNAVFYGLLALGQCTLAFGAQNPPPDKRPGWCPRALWFPYLHAPDAYFWHALLDACCATAAPVYILVASAICSHGPAEAPDWASCYGENPWPWVLVVFIFGLAFNTAAVFIRTWVRAEQPCRVWVQIALSATAYAIGLVFVISAPATGCQFLHLAGAFCFLLGFIFQMEYVLMLADNPQPKVTAVLKGQALKA